MAHSLCRWSCEKKRNTRCSMSQSVKRWIDQCYEHVSLHWLNLNLLIVKGEGEMKRGHGGEKIYQQKKSSREERKYWKTVPITRLPLPLLLLLLVMGRKKHKDISFTNGGDSISLLINDFLTHSHIHTHMHTCIHSIPSQMSVTQVSNQKEEKQAFTSSIHNWHQWRYLYVGFCVRLSMKKENARQQLTNICVLLSDKRASSNDFAMQSTKETKETTKRRRRNEKERKP